MHQNIYSQRANISVLLITLDKKWIELKELEEVKLIPGDFDRLQKKVTLQ